MYMNPLLTGAVPDAEAPLSTEVLHLHVHIPTIKQVRGKRLMFVHTLYVFLFTFWLRQDEMSLSKIIMRISRCTTLLSY
jgi:hypothetical protein